MIEVTKSIFKEIYKKRPDDAKKYDYGLLLIIGGSDFYSGPPVFSALAAYKAGVDMVRIIAPERVANIAACQSPNIASYPLKGERVEKKHLNTLISMTEAARALSRDKVAVIIGGGMGRSIETQETILEYLSKVSVPIVVDADGIRALAKSPEVVFKNPCVITSHSNEFFALTRKEISTLSEEKKGEIIKQEASLLGATILFKDKVDIISNGDKVAKSIAGTSYMTVGGTGDVLAGIVGAFLAMGIDAFDSAKAGILLNDLAGEIASKKLKQSLTAMDIIDAIPEVLK